MNKKYTFRRFFMQMIYTCLTLGLYPTYIMLKYFHEH